MWFAQIPLQVVTFSICHDGGPGDSRDAEMLENGALQFVALAYRAPTVDASPGTVGNRSELIVRTVVYWHVLALQQNRQLLRVRLPSDAKLRNAKNDLAVFIDIAHGAKTSSDIWPAADRLCAPWSAGQSDLSWSTTAGNEGLGSCDRLAAGISLGECGDNWLFSNVRKATSNLEGCSLSRSKRHDLLDRDLPSIKAAPRAPMPSVSALAHLRCRDDDRAC